MKASDFEIRNYEKLDKILSKLCALVVEGQKSRPEHFGKVAAAVLDPDNNLVARLNCPGQDGRRIHAERAAMEAYEKQYGNIPEGSIVLTTCSPCSEHMNERDGPSCTDYINNSIVKKVYCGYTDPTQDEEQREFNILETKDSEIRDLCKTFADTFIHKVSENFANGKNPQDKGDSKRYHVPTKGSVSSLRKFAKGHSGRAAQLAHWMANMKSGHKK
jgi:pyrimidine deaminase RibD-like protein